MFIDYKSAYNTVLRDELYRTLVNKKILTADEANLLKVMHDCLYFEAGGERYYLKNGVHQGSPISPALFNIYIEDVMQEIKQQCTAGDELWYKLYADDLVLVAKHNTWRTCSLCYSVSHQNTI